MPPGDLWIHMGCNCFWDGSVMNSLEDSVPSLSILVGEPIPEFRLTYVHVGETPDQPVCKIFINVIFIP